MQVHTKHTHTHTNTIHRNEIFLTGKHDSDLTGEGWNWYKGPVQDSAKISLLFQSAATIMVQKSFAVYEIHDIIVQEYGHEFQDAMLSEIEEEASETEGNVEINSWHEELSSDSCPKISN